MGTNRPSEVSGQDSTATQSQRGNLGHPLISPFPLLAQLSLDWKRTQLASAYPARPTPSPWVCSVIS